MADDDAADADFYQVLGEILVRWNACEGRLREMVIWLAGGRSPATLALTAHMTGKSLIDALPALTGAKSAEVREHFEHYAKAVDILREHRNYFAHGVSQVGVGMLEPRVSAWVSQVTGKHRVKIHFEHVLLSQLRALAEELNRVDSYGWAILQCANPKRGLFGLGPKPPPYTWPSKPPLPEKLRKRPPILLGAPPPPESSEG